MEGIITISWFKSLKLGQSNIIVYQGRLKGDPLSNFYSTDKQFAEEYGKIQAFLLIAENIFDSSNKEHLDLLFKEVGKITDPYDGKVFNTVEEFYDSGLIITDTWESIEQYISYIVGMGFDAIKIYEGGVENYYVINPQKSIVHI